jgi:hypothetical protein
VPDDAQLSLLGSPAAAAQPEPDPFEELERQAVARMTIDEFSEAGLVIRVHSRALSREVRFASDNADPAALRKYGSAPVYRASEMRTLIDASPDAAGLQVIHAVKEAFDGTVTDEATVDDRSA